MGAEKTFENKIKKYLAERDAYFLKILGGVPGIPNGTPDILACVDGLFVAIEIKRPDGKGRVSKLQKYQMERIKRAGGIAFVADNMEDFTKEIDRIIRFSKESPGTG